jgi:hypothetical protein
MKPTPTKTLNPLPFQDLEPHRFEDLVRQLHTEPAIEERLWIFQCKREKTLSPKQVRKVIGESLAQATPLRVRFGSCMRHLQKCARYISRRDGLTRHKRIRHMGEGRT